MSENEKLERLKAMTGETDTSVLLTYLAIAGERVIRKAYPFREDITEVPAKYVSVQLEVACFLLNKRGAEGEKAHSENGISRTYENANVPDSMLSSITPVVGVI